MAFKSLISRKEGHCTVDKWSLRYTVNGWTLIIPRSLTTSACSGQCSVPPKHNVCSSIYDVISS